ncbi:MAG: AarF/UbiB family protein [Pseudomonadota bacterium]
MWRNIAAEIAAMNEEHDEKKTTRAPTGRLERLFKLSGTATGVAARLAGERLLEKLVPPQRRAGMRKKALTRSGEQMVEMMGQLKGAAMKVGQMLSVDPEAMPPEIQQALATLQRSAPPMDYEQVVAQIESALEQPIHQVFKYFDPDPVGAASIGQVHRAETFDGRVVAVKVQYPGIADTLESDLKNLASLMTMAGVVMERERVNSYLAEVRDVLIEESDYLHEAHNLARFHDLLAPYPWVRVPVPDLERTASTVLTMEYIAGQKLDDYLEAMPAGEQRNALAERFVQLMATMFHELHELHADPHPGNFMVDDQGRIVLLDFGCVRRFPETFTEGIIEILVCLWNGDAEELLQTYRRLGYGTSRVQHYDPEVIYAFTELVLAPFLDDAPFDFGAWDVHERIRELFLHNIELTTFVPPREAILYLRVVAGLRGLLKRLHITFNAGRMGRDFAAAHGFGEW